MGGDMYIIKQSKNFHRRIGNHFVTKFGLKKQQLSVVKSLSSNCVYSFKNCYVVPNHVINSLYDSNTCKTQTGFSCVFSLYKNIHHSTTRNGDMRVCLDTATKAKMSLVLDEMKSFTGTAVESFNCYVIGRKYKHKKGDVKPGCFDVCCKIPLSIGKEVNSTPIITPSTLIDGGTKTKTETIDRRQFSLELKKVIASKYLNETTMYMRSILQRSVFLDVEYLNDIIDDFKTFPVSQDLSMLFMIGFAICDKRDNLSYTNLLVEQLTQEEEYKILEQLLGMFRHLLSIHQQPLYVFHWSPADNTTINKAMSKYPLLHNEYNSLLGSKIHFVDLMKVFRGVAKFDSYSLKNVAREILNYQYDSQCQNGFEAMISTIECFDKNSNNKDIIMKDIIHYNKIDTEILHKLVCELLYPKK